MGTAHLPPDLRADTAGSLRARLTVSASMVESGYVDLLAVRNEVAYRLKVLADDWTPDRTLGPNERDLVAFAAALLGTARVLSVVE